MTEAQQGAATVAARPGGVALQQFSWRRQPVAFPPFRDMGLPGPGGLWTWERPLIDEDQYWRRIRELDGLGMDGERVENQGLHNELAARIGWN